MKRLAVILMAVGLFGAMPVLAADQNGMKMDTQEGVRQCALQAETLQGKIERLKTAIAKGQKKYSAEELANLKRKLDEANKTLDMMLMGP